MRRRAELYYQQLEALRLVRQQASGLGLQTHDSAQYRVVEQQLQRSKKSVTLRGLNTNHNHDLKDIFKGAAMRASTAAGPRRDFYVALPG